MPPIHDGMGGGSHHGAIAARHAHTQEDDQSPEGLFPDIPEAKKRKFILVEDNKRGCRLRVRVTLENVDTKEIPDSFRKSSSVFPRSYFPREMQSPPPSATGSQFFQEDLSDDDVEVEGGRTGRSRGNPTRDRVMAKVPMSDGTDGELAIPRIRRGTRGREVRLNDLGYRMAWLQSRVFAGRTIFLQRACKSEHMKCARREAGRTHRLTRRQWTATATRRAGPLRTSCRTSRRWRLTTRRAWASGSGASACGAARSGKRSRKASAGFDFSARGCD